MALPGAVKKYVGNEQCEYNDCTATATHEVCTESDSFGDEWEPRCEKHLPDPDAKDIGDCDQCHAKDVVVVPTRDPEEIHGPVSYLCPTCLSDHRKYVNSLMEEFHDDMEEEDDFYETEDDFDVDEIEDDNNPSVQEMRDMVIGWLWKQCT